MGVIAAPAYAIDGKMPARVVGARSIEDVVATLRESSARGEGVVPVGGATRLAVGNAPHRYDVALDVSALAGILEHEPGDLTATVRAGTTLAALRAQLARHGQMWPVEVGLPERATVGGVLSGADAGPSRLAYLHPRDWVVGVRAVLGDGTLTKAGGKVVKNVTAYDLTRFYAGSYGTLCVLVEASLKLWPLPEAERTLVARFASAAAGRDGLAALRGARVALDAAAVLDGTAARLAGSDAACLVAVRLRGTRPAVERLVDRVVPALAAAGPSDAPGSLWEEIAAVPHRADIALRVAAPEGHIGRLLDAAGTGALHYHGTGIAYLVRDAEEAAGPGPGSNTLALPVDGNATRSESKRVGVATKALPPGRTPVEADARWVRERRAMLEAAEGSLVVERAPAALKAAVDAWGTPALPPDLARRIKDALDPRGALSPGRFAGGL